MAVWPHLCQKILKFMYPFLGPNQVFIKQTSTKHDFENALITSSMIIIIAVAAIYFNQYLNQ